MVAQCAASKESAAAVLQVNLDYRVGCVGLNGGGLIAACNCRQENGPACAVAVRLERRGLGRRGRQ